MRINPEFLESDNHVRSNRACVAGALEKDRNGFHRWFDPPLFGSSHKSRALIEHMGRMGKLFFDKTDVAAAFDAREPNPGKVVDVCAKTHILFQIVHGEMVAAHRRKIALTVTHDDIGLAFDQDSKSM